jgi:DNA polymerase I
MRSVIAVLKYRKIYLYDLIIWKTLTKTLDDYAIKAPHVQATNMLKEKRLAINWRQQKIGYVILEGKERCIVE